jgi:hypothetical protein
VPGAPTTLHQCCAENFATSHPPVSHREPHHRVSRARGDRTLGAPRHASRATQAILSSGQANSVGPWGEMSVKNCAAIFLIFHFCLYFQKNIEIKKSIENTIKLRKIQNKFL